MNDFTVKDIANLLSVSKTTISKAIKAAEMECDYVQSNRQYFSAEKTRQLILAVKPDFDVSFLLEQVANSQTKSENSQTETANLKEKSENSQTETANLEKKTANSQTKSENSQTETDSELELVRAMVKTLQEQLAIKDKQIAAYQEQISMQGEQIKDYSARLKEAMQLTKGQQLVSVAEKAERIAERTENQETLAAEPEKNIIEVKAAESKPKEETEQPKKNFWRKLFGL